MKVLQVNCVYKKGSTGKITYDLHKGLLDNGMEAVVCYGRGELINEPGVYKTCPEWYSKLNNALSRITGIMYGGCFFSTNQLISVIKKEKPDVVHLHCINGYFVNIYRLLNWLKKQKIPTVLTLHAEFMYTGGCGYSIDCNQWSTRGGCGHSAKCPRWRVETKSLFLDRTGTMWKRMKNAFDGFDKDKLIIVSVSPWLMERAKSSPMLENYNHTVIYNGLDTNIFKHYDASELKKKHGITDEKIIFHATPYFNDDPNHIKGGYYVIELAKKMIDENVKFFIAGSYKENMTLPSNIVLLGKLTDQNQLAQYYSMADVTVLTSQRETFSMVVAESLSCGTPVVGFKAGAPEQIAIQEYSRFVEYGDTDKLMNNITEFLNFAIKKKNIEKAARDEYTYNRMIAEYFNIYQRM